MSSLFGIGAGSASTGFYPETIDQSLRFDGGGDLRNSSFSTPTDNQNWTWSAWVKLAIIDSGLRVLFQADTNSVDALQTNNNNLTLTVAGTSGTTTAKYRDATSWYHVLFNYNGSNAYLYINNRLDLTLSPSGNSKFNNSSYTHFLGQNGSNSRYWSGYMAEVNFIDGQALNPSSFGESKNGTWIPKSLSSLTYGTNGFRLTFADSSSLGDDTSGNGNDFTVAGTLASTDVVPDSPTNNFCTFNPLDPTNMTLAEGNLETDKASNASNDGVNGTFLLTSGKWYFEFKPKYFSSGSGGFGNVGVRNPSGSAKDALGSGNAPNATVLYLFDGNVQDFNSDTTYFPTGGSGYTYGATGSEMIYGVALDMDNGKIWFSINGTYPNSGNPATGTNEARDDINTNHPDGVFPAISSYNVAFIANFGQNPSFNGDVGNSGHTAGTESDSNGIGLFKYAPPTGFLAVCSSNLPDTTISPNQSTQADDHFNTVLWTGDDTTPRTITGVGFQPDWIWHKPRTDNIGYSRNHWAVDSSRGSGSNSLLTLYPNLEDPEFDNTGANGNLTAITSDGFTITGGSSTNKNRNNSGQNFVAWNWKAGGTTPTKTYKVVVVSDSGNKYRFRNSADSATFAQSAVTLDLQEGGTYVFDWSDSSAQGHPIRFSLTSNGTHGGGSEYTTGVVKDDSAYKTTITVASGVATLYYYCQYHSGMGGQINTNTTFGSTNFDGSLLSVSNPNTTAGFSIITYTGGGSAGDTIGHGLNSAPEQVWFKRRGATGNWMNYVKAMGNNGYINLDRTNGKDTGGSPVNNTDPSSTVITLGSFQSLNSSSSNNTYVAYAFHSVEGYSKMGSYTGNGNTSADGTYVNLGFRPSWLLIKRTDSSSGWVLWDNKRSTSNPTEEYLLANDIQVEQSSSTTQRVDFLSNGFKAVNTSTSNTINGSSTTHIYMAFAEQPFKFSNAR